MIFYDTQLMPDTGKARLFMVSNPIALERYEDHEAALYLQLHELVERSRAEGQDPVALLEDYLETVYTDGHNPEEIANFLFHHDKMQSVLWSLKESWSNLDKTLPGDSLMYGGLGREEMLEVYAETTLRTYLEALVASQEK